MQQAATGAREHGAATSAGSAAPNAAGVAHRENLAARLAESLANVFPGWAHVSTAGLAGAPDTRVWAHAAAEGFVRVT